MTDLPNPNDQLPPIWNIRYPRIEQWLNRDAIFTRIQETLSSDHVCVVATPEAKSRGLGLSSLAREYAYQQAENYQMVWWVDADTEAATIVQYTQLCAALDMLQQKSKRSFHSMEETQQRLESHTGWLVIFNQAVDVDFIKSLLPKDITGHVIITTSEPGDHPCTLNHPLSIGELNERYESMSLSNSIATSLLNGNVLALDLLYAYHLQTGEKADDLLVSILQALDNLEDPNPHDLFRAVLRYSLKYLSGQDPVAKDFIVLCSFLSPHDIPRFIFDEGDEVLTPKLVETIADEELFQQMLSPLLGLGLMQETENALAMHPAVQEALHDSMPANALKAWCNAAGKLLEEAFPTGKPYKHPSNTCIRLLPHMFRSAKIAEHHESTTQTTSTILFLAGLYIHAHGLIDETHMCYLRSIKIAETLLGTTHPIVASRVNNLGTIEHELGALDNAQTCFERSIEIYEALFGPSEKADHFNVDDSMITTPLRNLCSVLEDKGDINRAQRAFEKSIKTFVKIYGWEHSIVAECAHSFGNTWITLKNMEKAKNCFMKAVRAEESAYDCDNTALATYLNSLGLCFLKEQKPDLALEQLERAWRLDQMELEAGDLRLSRDLINLGHAYKQLNKLDEGEVAYRDALAILRADSGRHRKEISSIQLNLGMILLGKHDFENARSQLDSALSMQTELYGDSSTELIPILVNIGKALDGMKQPIPALSSYERALDLLETKESDNHMDRATVLYRIGRSYQHDDQLDTALSFFEQALSVDTKHAGEGHSHVARDAYAIGTTLEKQGDSIVAMGHLTLALDIYENVHGKDHPKTRAVRKKLDGLNF